MHLTATSLVEVENVQQLLYRMLPLRDYILGYLAAKGGEARLEELVKGLELLSEQGIAVTASPRELRAELEYLAALGILEKVDGRVKLRKDTLSAVLKRKVERLARILAPVA